MNHYFKATLNESPYHVIYFKFTNWEGEGNILLEGIEVINYEKVSLIQEEIEERENFKEHFWNDYYIEIYNVEEISEEEYNKEYKYYFKNLIIN